MHVGLNLVFLVPGETGGMEVVARELVPALRDAAPHVRFTAFVNRTAAREDLGVPATVVDVDARSRVQWVRGEQQLLPGLARRAGCDVVHSFASTAPIWGRFARVTTIHDLLYLVVPEAHFGVRALGMRVLVPLAARRSHRVLAVSSATRDDLVQHLHVSADKIDVVPNGLGRLAAVEPTPVAVVRERYDLGDRSVLLCLSAKRPHKNLAVVLRALAAIPPDERPVAVLAGYPTPYEAELRATAEQLGIAADVRWPGWVDDADVEGLFAITGAFAFPSRYEGFGLPVLEAMARGVPVVCADTASLPEVAGDAARLVAPDDADGLARAVRELLADPAGSAALGEAGRQRAATFTWARTARLTLAAYERALAAS